MNDKILMGIATVMSFGLLYALLFIQIPDKNVQIFVFLAGIVCGFFFGSSINKTRPPDTSIPNQPAPQGQPKGAVQ